MSVLLGTAMIGAFFLHALYAKDMMASLHKNGAFSRITIEEAQAITQDPNVVFIDARSAEEYASGHIPQSICLPHASFAEIYPLIQQALSPKATLITYCEGERCGLSDHLRERLSREGFKDVRVLSGGWLAWRDKGLPWEIGEPSWKKGSMRLPSRGAGGNAPRMLLGRKIPMA
ncbi:MAG: rhodanese-like domain-containing protein [Candidatus Tectomicrobia bacterium]|uniref:Rhodanese-like domain-containing protein n=1 Tax=Tectimicrobiota bacterium TaxID=2528274 RepID=A0A932FWC0_UNCTE|nr:rhodanese-like domain-containing protein [Candidatus Tectomicrobia bacterium]